MKNLFRHSEICGASLIRGVFSVAAIAVFSPPVIAAEAIDGSTPAAPQTASCSVRYHARLTGDVLARARTTQQMADAMRQPSSEMPGHWLFWNGSGIAARNAYQRRLLATQLINKRDNLMCMRSVLVRGGRIRCMKWKPMPAGYVPPPPKLPSDDPSKPEISQAERQIASQLSSRVLRKGAFAELRRGTPLYHQAQRATDELIGYASQPHRSTICNGAIGLLGFYRRQIKQIKGKAEEARNLLDEARKIARGAIAVALDVEAGSFKVTDADYADLIRKLVASEATESEMEAFADDNSPLKQLEAARAVLTDQRLAEIIKDQRGRLRKALRDIEFAIYAIHNEYYLARLYGSFDTTLKAIRSAHRETCQCSP